MMNKGYRGYKAQPQILSLEDEKLRRARQQRLKNKEQKAENTNDIVVRSANHLSVQPQTTAQQVMAEFKQVSSIVKMGASPEQLVSLEERVFLRDKRYIPNQRSYRQI